MNEGLFKDQSRPFRATSFVNSDLELPSSFGYSSFVNHMGICLAQHFVADYNFALVY